MRVDKAWITTPQRTFLDLGSVLSVRDLVKVADGLLNYHEHRASKPPELTLEELKEFIEDTQRMPGKNKCSEALRYAAVGSDSVQETELRLVLQEHGITGLVPNAPVINEWGWVMFEPDLADFEYELSIQYEGSHHGDTRQMRKDEDRLRKPKKWVG